MNIEKKQSSIIDNYNHSDTKRNYFCENPPSNCDSVNLKISDENGLKKLALFTQDGELIAPNVHNPVLQDNVSGLFHGVLCNDVTLSRYSEGEVKRKINSCSNLTEKSKSQIENTEKLLLLRKQDKKNILKQLSESDRLLPVPQSCLSVINTTVISEKLEVTDFLDASLCKKVKEDPRPPFSSESISTSVIAPTETQCSLLESSESASAENLSLQRLAHNDGPIYTSPNFENKVTSSADSNQIFSSGRNSVLVSSSLYNISAEKPVAFVFEQQGSQVEVCNELGSPQAASDGDTSDNVQCTHVKKITDDNKTEFAKEKFNLRTTFIDDDILNTNEECKLTKDFSSNTTASTEQSNASLETTKTAVQASAYESGSTALQLIPTKELCQSIYTNSAAVESIKMNKAEMTREEIKAEREAKKLAKQAKKQKAVAQPQLQRQSEEVSDNLKLEETAEKLSESNSNINLGKTQVQKQITTSNKTDGVSESRVEQLPAFHSSNVRATKEASLPFQLKKDDSLTKRKQGSSCIPAGTNASDDEKAKEISTGTKPIASPLKSPESTGGKSKAELRAERRAKQEAQRAAKQAQKLASVRADAVSKEERKVSEEKQSMKAVKSESTPIKSTEAAVVKKTAGATSVQHKVKLFNHLYQSDTPLVVVGLDTTLHPAVVQLGIQFKSRVISGSNARCVALLHALKQVIQDYQTSPQEEFSRGMESCLRPLTNYLQACRPLPVSATNALRHLNRQLTLLPNIISDEEAKKKLHEAIDTYIKEQIDVAGQAICNSVLDKITNGDTILTYGCSSLLTRILVKAHQNGKNFRVVVADGRPWLEGREMLRRLLQHGLCCSYVLLPAASFIMREVTKVLLGAHSLLANGYVMSRAGSSQIALLANAYNVPVLVCCETHKFCERVQTDSFVYNEIGDPHDLGVPGWLEVGCLTPLNLTYDVTPPDLVTAVVTELAILPCTSVPVILRIKPSETVI